MRHLLRDRPSRSRFLFNLAITALVTASFAAPANALVNTVVATVQINPGGSLEGLAISPDSKFVYVASYYSNTIAVLDTSTNQVGATRLVAGNGPQQMVFSPSGTQLYIVDIVVDIFNGIFQPTGSGAGALSLISGPPTVQGAFTKTIPGLGGYPTALAITSDGKTIYVPDFESGLVSVVETSSNTVSPVQVQAGSGPDSVAFTPDGSFAYIANYNDNTVTVIATVTQSVVGPPIAVGTNPENIVITPDGTQAYVTNLDGTVSVIKTASNTVSTSISLGARNDRQFGMQSAITPDGKYLYAPCEDAYTVVVVNTKTNKVVGKPISVGGVPTLVAIAHNGKHAYVVNSFDNTVSVISITGG
jgi:YVTN family beta-propeller protein